MPAAVSLGRLSGLRVRQASTGDGGGGCMGSITLPLVAALLLYAVSTEWKVAVSVLVEVAVGVGERSVFERPGVLFSPVSFLRQPLLASLVKLPVVGSNGLPFPFLLLSLLPLELLRFSLNDSLSCLACGFLVVNHSIAFRSSSVARFSSSAWEGSIAPAWSWSLRFLYDDGFFAVRAHDVPDVWATSHALTGEEPDRLVTRNEVVAVFAVHRR